MAKKNLHHHKNCYGKTTKLIDDYIILYRSHSVLTPTSHRGYTRKIPKKTHSSQYTGKNVKFPGFFWQKPVKSSQVFGS